jgi:DNA invertase Pin-like site-specific DNA recombinase
LVGRCDVMRAEKRSDTTTNGRTELQTVLDFIRKADVLMVTRIDRLVRSIGDLQDIVRGLKTKGASLKATEQSIDTSTAAGNASSTCWVCSPSSRQTFGESVNSRGSPKPRRKASTREESQTSIRQRWHGSRRKASAPLRTAKRLGIGRASVYRVGASKEV